MPAPTLTHNRLRAGMVGLGMIFDETYRPLFQQLHAEGLYRHDFGFVDHIVGVSPVESRWILEHLFAELTRPEYTVWFRWEPGSVAFWDNRATAHLGPQDLGHLDVERVLHRVTLIGEVPVGPDGTESQLIEGVPFVATPVFAPSGT